MYGGQPVSSTVSFKQDIDDKTCGGNSNLSMLWPILVCLLGNFRVLKWGQPVVFPGSKVEVLLRLLGLYYQYAVPREQILETLWPGHDPGLACQSLNSLLYSLRKSLAVDGHNGALILHEDGYYRLNKEAGIATDIACFEELVKSGDDYVHTGNTPVAVPFYIQATQLYRGDLCASTDIQSVIERERLRVHFLRLLARLADYFYSVADYPACLQYANRLLENDTCREDAHRLLMRCFVRQGERAQALRQYRLCTHILHAEFDAVPERDTTRLYHQIRLNPESV
jgi:DNA-binding SARP family transcriptional activator